MYRYILFDLDGTLILPEGGHYKMRTICAAVFWY